MKAVIRKSDGALLRAGHCDFTSDGSFDALNEDIVDIDIRPLKRIDDPDFDTFHRWTCCENGVWAEVPKDA